MRYTGHIRFEDVETGDLDVSVEVDDTHVRLASGGASLGSWCLADVVAARLVANEFELDLGTSRVRFVADDPINFAYGAVQSMAEGWARYHSMNFLLRHRTIAVARRRNEPDRLDDVRAAFVAARDELREPPRVELVEPPVPATGETADDVNGPGEEIPVPAGAETSPGDGEDESPSAPIPAPPQPIAASEAPSVEREGAAAADEGAESGPRGVVRPGRLLRLDALPRRGDTDRPSVTEEPDPDRHSTEAEPEPDAGDAERGGEAVTGQDLSPTLPDDILPDDLLSDDILPEIPSSVPAAESPDSEAPEEVAVSDVDTVVDVDLDEEAHEPLEPEPHRRLRPSHDEVDPGDGGDAAHEPVRVPVGAFADGHHPAETSGVRASLRSMFGRSKTGSHEHAFVDSTTAVGITRRVCLECGYVSIGIDE